MDDTLTRYSAVPSAEVFTGTPSDDAALAALLRTSSPAAAPIRAPVFLGQGGADLTVQVEITRVVGQKYCASGSDVTIRNYDGIDHDGVVDAAADDVLEFVTARFADEPPGNDCT